MKITKRQLRRIIKEEKAKLLINENKLELGDRALSVHANYPVMNQAISSLEKMYDGIIESAVADGLEEDEAEDMAGEAVLELARGIVAGFGHLNASASLK